MSKLLIVSSTAAELTPLQTFFLCPPFPEFQISTVNRHIDVLITGIGMAAAAFQMGKIPPLKYSALIQAGIAGSFSEQLKLGTVCNVTEDCFSELGAETADGFISADAMNLPMDYKFKLHTPTHLKIPEWKKVKGVTVNTVSGRDASIAALRARFNPDIESMEGASFAMACMYLQYQGLQLRAISNRIENRNATAWNIPLAIEQLNAQLIELICLNNLK